MPVPVSVEGLLSMNVLVVGGAGYIGSHMVKMLLGEGQHVITLDNLSGGYRDAVLGGEFVEGTLADRALLNTLFALRKIDAVMHFASFIQVGKSMREPGMYYQNNLANTLNLLDAMRTHGCRRLIFSSTAAIFGEPSYVPIDEAHPQIPINPYGVSKWMVERILRDYDAAYGLQSVCLRYFNACGADPEGLLGERHVPETHLIPLVLQAASGRSEAIRVFGDDYPTEDGTCVRDYVHVEDLCSAHWLALNALQNAGKSAVFNLGNGQGYSVQQVIETAREVTGRPIRVIREARRPGDPARLVADSRRAVELLGWQPRHAALDTIIEHAWQWEQKTSMPALPARIKHAVSAASAA